MTDTDSNLSLESKRCEELDYDTSGGPEYAAIEEHVGNFTPLLNDANFSYLTVQFIKAIGKHDYDIADGCAGDLAGFVLEELNRASAVAQDVLNHPFDVRKAVKLVNMIVGDALFSSTMRSSLIAQIWMQILESNGSSGHVDQALGKAPDGAGEE